MVRTGLMMKMALTANTQRRLPRSKAKREVTIATVNPRSLRRCTLRLGVAAVVTSTGSVTTESCEGHELNRVLHEIPALPPAGMTGLDHN